MKYLLGWFLQLQCTDGVVVDRVAFDYLSSVHIDSVEFSSRPLSQSVPKLLPCSVNITGLPDFRHQERVDWIHKWLPGHVAKQYAIGDTRILSQVEAQFDALLVHGEELPKLVEMVSDWRSIFPGKAIIAVTGWRHGVVELLEAGADLVCDTSMHPAEASSAFIAVLRRVKEAEEKSQVRLSSRPFKVDTLRPLSRSEDTIMSTVLLGEPNPVSYADIFNRLGKCVSTDAMRTLRVQVHNLNRNMLNARIKAVRGTGLVFVRSGHHAP